MVVRADIKILKKTLTTSAIVNSGERPFQRLTFLKIKLLESEKNYINLGGSG